jgi:DeoR/GlpR family transcriptional regulator of sugar metabolism
MITSETCGLAAERVDRIRRILKQRGAARVDELSAELGVSAATVRRDLVELDALGQARRVHGGAVTMQGRLDEPVFDDRTAIAVSEKQRIAEAAFRMIKPSDSIFLDGGSTLLALARMLVDMPALTVVSNSLSIAATFTAAGPRMILVGGEFRRRSQTFVGSLSQSVIERLRVDTAFMGTVGLSADGLTTTDPREAFTKELIMARARQVVVLADNTKVGTESFVRFGSLDRVNTLITDRGADQNILKKLRKIGISVIAV